ncbi:hypothetical protein SARC_09520 [Sphaeroforma arctica JP610]|uniref:VWFA domain-containing protein n=1 Tax=Sphaeroforma arctica JP610 TaxID=667725 RepID=A0A0L0FNI6_9EUKA|nr:hypothetical protein SARC_09520 [Sphaeroforma arctica JP610]KNC78036.1 hypothetical protein SARC_09520 [Sphaeroforma arctica JP610]|eukprot:XP_014151938.1 hypothetical protein SARC_09520 [Sphaeroforma arctica JP610]
MTVVYGLYWVCHQTHQRQPVSLSRVTVTANIVDMAAQVHVTQHYNPPAKTSCDSEFAYTFPLDNKAAVCGFKLVVDAREIEGIVKEKAEAKKDYEQAMEQGKTAALMEESQADIFSISLGNISSNAKEISTTITYLVKLKMDLDDIRFFLPTHIGARYTPPGTVPVAINDAAVAPITLKLDWNMPFAIASFISPTHASMVWTHIDSTHVCATVKSITQGDIVVLCRPEKPHEARACLEKSEDGSRVLMVTFVPRLELEEQKCEFVFVIDRSGSMSGPQFDDARAALELFLRSLPEDCYINVVGFGSRYDVLFENKSKRYSDTSLKQASAYASRMSANFGGTEIVAPLKHIYDNLAPIKGYARQLFVLTDGQVSNTEEVIAMVRKQSTMNSLTRMFTLGIGLGVSHNLVDGMARVGNGTTAYVTNSDRLAATIIRQLKASHAPAINNIAIDWLEGKEKTHASGRRGSGDIVKKTKTLLGYLTPSKRSTNDYPASPPKQTPYVYQPIFDGDRFLAYYFLGKDDPTPKKVTINANIPGVGDREELTETVLPILQDNVYEGTQIIHTLAARSMIQDLEDGKSYPGINSQPASAKAEIIDLGIKHNLVSKYTSYVAVDHSSAKEHIHKPCRYTPAPVDLGKNILLKNSGNMCFRAVPRSRSEPLPPQCAPGGPNQPFGGGFTMSKCAAPPPPPSGHGAFMCAPKPAPLKGGFGCAPAPSALGGGSISPFRSLEKSEKSAKKSKKSASGRGLMFNSMDACMRMSSAEPVPIDNAPGLSRQRDLFNDGGSSDKDDNCDEDLEGEQEEETPRLQQSTTLQVMTPREKMTQLIQLQSFDGSFVLTSALLGLVGVDRATLDTVLQRMSLTGTPDNVLGTTVAIMLMEYELGSLSELQLVCSKAHRWLAAQCKNAKEVMSAVKSTVQSMSGGH